MSVWEGGIDTCIYRCALSCMHGGARRECQVSCRDTHSQSRFFGTDSLTELGVRLTAGKPSDPPFSVLIRTEIKGGREHF